MFLHLHALAYQWEIYHDKLFRSNPEIDDKVNVQHIPYVVCAAASLLLFWYKVFEKNNIMRVCIGLGVTVICAIIFWKKWNLNTVEIKEAWKKMQE